MGKILFGLVFMLAATVSFAEGLCVQFCVDCSRNPEGAPCAKIDQVCGNCPAILDSIRQDSISAVARADSIKKAMEIRDSLQKEDSGNTAMYILDGKYYLLSVSDGKLFGNPGIQDVVTQYVYNASLKSFIDTFQIGEIANAFLIPALESENAENQNYGEVPYWTAQHSPFNELPSVQVIKLQAQKVWDFYLGTQTDNASIFNLIQKYPTKNYLYHNENDNSIIQINDGKKHILVGFMRKDYFDTVCSLREKGEKCIRYPLHPFIDSCSEFIGYSNDRKHFIHGTLKQVYKRCRIDEVTAERLSELLPVKVRNAKTYYMITVENCSDVSNIPYEGVISSKEDLNRLIRENGLNDVLSQYSPKVIDV